MPNTGIVWIASYPKSGNTWVRFLVAGLVDGPLDDTARARAVVPDLHEGLDPSSFAGGGRVFVKTHLKFSPEMPLGRFTAGFIHVVRHPLDVLASNLNFLKLTSFERMSRMDERSRRAYLDEYVDRYISCSGDPRWVAAGMGSWTEHWLGWRDAATRIPGLLLRYEDLQRDTRDGARRICDFLGLTRGTGEIDEIVGRSSFERMRALEEREIREGRAGFFFRPEFAAAHGVGRRFMHRGRAGEGRRDLSPEQVARAEAAFREPMRQLEYA